MSLPIIILLERHWDVEAKKALMSVLPFLNASGYNTLCFESACEKSEQETIAGIESTIKFVEERLGDANRYLAKRGISVDLFAMDFDELQKLLFNYVSTKYSAEMALWFKELPGHKEKLNMVRIAVEKKMEICGIDLTREQLETVQGVEAQTNLSKRTSKMRELDNVRTLVFTKNMLELQQQGRGVIFVVGQSHYMPLVEEFSKDYYLGEIVFLHPYVAKCFDKSIIDYCLPSSLDNQQLITLVEKNIGGNNDIEIFMKALKATIQPMLNKCVLIDPTSACQILNDKTRLHFEAYVRPSHLVNSYHFFNNREDMAVAVSELRTKGVHGFFTVFKNKEAYCIPCINTQEVQSQIQKLDL